MRTIRLTSERGPMEVTPIKSKKIFKVVTAGSLYHTYQLTEEEFHDAEYNTVSDWNYMMWYDKLLFIKNNPIFEVKVRIDGKNTKNVWVQAPSKRWLHEYGEPWGRKIIKIY